MKRALFLLLDQYADWEGSYLTTVLNQSVEWDVKTISLDKKVKSIGGLSTVIDYNLNEIEHYDLLVLIGGNSWNIEDLNLYNFINKAFFNKKYIGAICGSVDYLAKNGFLNTYSHTGNSKYLWNQYQAYTPQRAFVEEQAVKDDNLVTANGTAAVEFTDLVLKLIDFDSIENINKTTFINKHGFYGYCNTYGNPYL
ncbi:type 1 glutamine amidotransferase family protein [Staphylococcus saprophyticus]|uniref:type 1 glutamine amidotransferase family protein n=1 Tax=Staphylococcus saprophyticus TaxID=29385 RepID=UPI000D1FA4C9|nr:type 1 glutamine amidotransferase family protein [Staphylococcus saprophyticus]PTJ62461.1 glutamine amidotransferase [Staphylococcus saprophyticus]